MTLQGELDLSTLTRELLSGHWTVAAGLVDGVHRFYTATRVPQHQERRGALSSGEREVLLRVLRGESNKQIACGLGVGASGVSTLLTRARKKLGGRVPEELLSCLVGAAAATPAPPLAAAS